MITFAIGGLPLKYNNLLILSSFSFMSLGIPRIVHTGLTNPYSIIWYWVNTWPRFYWIASHHHLFYFDNRFRGYFFILNSFLIWGTDYSFWTDLFNLMATANTSYVDWVCNFIEFALIRCNNIKEIVLFLLHCTLKRFDYLIFGLPF